MEEEIEVKMIYVYCGILAVYLLLFILSVKEEVPLQEKGSAVYRPFQKIACYMLRQQKRRNRRIGQKKPNWKKPFEERQLGNKLKTLQPSENSHNQVEAFQCARYALVLLVVFVGNVICLCLWASEQADSLLVQGRLIERNEYGKGKISVILSAKVEGEEKDEIIDYVVGERIYSESEIDKLYQEATTLLPDIIRGENVDLEDVRFDLELITAIDGYPFQISWESGNYKRIDTDGQVENQEMEQGEIVMLTAHFKYEDWTRDYQCYVQVNPTVYTDREMLHKQLEEAVRRQEKETRSDREMELPVSVGERQVLWKEMKEDSSGYVLGLAVIAAVMLYFGKDRELDQKLEQRKKQLLLDYPEIVNKITLYMGAGMTIRNAFMKMGEDYKKQTGGKKRYAYEEILLTCYELQSGKSEIEAYDRFGRRCQVQAYIKLSTLLSQNIRKGNKDLLIMLRREAEDAFAERKNLAKKLGEEAGTKLLLPMMMMLCVVMVIIMVPAYFSFM